VPDGVKGDSGSNACALLALNRRLSVLFCSIIRLNRSMKRSLALLACSIVLSIMERRGRRERSIALTAAYSVARVSGTGLLK
jgi:hypothetical protein